MGRGRLVRLLGVRLHTPRRPRRRSADSWLRAGQGRPHQRGTAPAPRRLAKPAERKGGRVLAKLSALFCREQEDWLQVNLSRWGDAEAADSKKFRFLKQAVLGR